MNNVTIIYWSSTGNTEQMANAIAEVVIAHEAPDDDVLDACRRLGAALAGA